MKKIMVTGASGFLGKALVKALIKRNHEVIEIYSAICDLSHPDSIQYLSSLEVDYVFHLAGKTGIPSSWEDPLLFYSTNVDATRHVLEYCRTQATPLHYVSAYVYGLPEFLPIDEKVEPKPNNPYAHSKWMAEKMCQFYHVNFNLPLTLSRPFNIYGPSQALSFFIASVYRQIKNKENIEVGCLMNKRDYLYIDDAVAAFIAIMEQGIDGEIYNIGSGVSHTGSAVIHLLQSLLGTDKPIVETSLLRKNDIADVCADITKISTHTGWQPKFDLQDGLMQMIEENNDHNIKKNI